MAADRWLRAAVVALVAGIAGAAFVVSFESIRDYAARTGSFPPGLEWLAPVLVDSFILAGSLAAVRRSRGGRNTLYPWSLVAAGAGVSVALNVAHAPDHLAARLVAVLAPAALLASFELLLAELRAPVFVGSEANCEPVHVEPPLPVAPDPSPPLSEPPADPERVLEPAATTRRRPGPRTATRSRVLALAAEATGQGERPSPSAIASEVGVSVRRVQELLAEART